MKNLFILLIFLSCNHEYETPIIQELNPHQTGIYGGYVGQCVESVKESSPKKLIYNIKCSPVFRNDKLTELLKIFDNWIENNCPERLEIFEEFSNTPKDYFWTRNSDEPMVIYNDSRAITKQIKHCEHFEGLRLGRIRN